MEHGVGGKLHSGGEWATCLCSSHGPTRKLTYVWASVKRNIVNTNVYKAGNGGQNCSFGELAVGQSDFRR